jgi:multiple sugar transport system substrate-binding protein
MRHVMARSALFAVALVLALAGVSCGGGDDDDAGEAADTGAATEAGGGGELSGSITVWGMGAEGEKLDVLAKDFMADNPGVQVKVTPISWDVAHDKLLTSVAGDTTPDVSQMGTTWMGEFAKTGALAEVPEDISLDGTFEGARNTAIVDGTTYGVPWYVETRVLYYRTDIAEKAGITEPPGTWEELKAMAQAMKEKGGAKYGISLAPNNWQEFMPFVWQNGGEGATEDGFSFDSPEVIEALEFYKSFFDEGLTSPSVPEGFDVTQGFVAGTHPMFFSGPWHMSLIEEQGGAELEGKWDVAPMPKQETGTSFVGGSDLVVFESSENKDAAWAFVSYLLEPEVQQKWYTEVSALPSVEAAWEQGELSTDEKLALFGEQLRDAKSPPPIPKWEQVAAEVVNTELEKVCAGNSTPEEGAQAMQQKAESIGTGA